MKKKNNKKLPRYDLGTMKRLPLGYLLPKGIGDTIFNVLQGQSIEPETQAMRANYMPNAIKQTSSGFTPVLNALSNIKTVPLTQTFNLGGLAVLSGLSNIAPATIAPTSNLALSAAATTGGKLLTGSGMLAALKAATAPTTTAITTNLGSKALLNTAGNIAAGVGALYGGYNIYNDISNAGSHRTASDMQKTLSRDTYTTAGGNMYDVIGNPDLSAELAYEDQARKAKLTSFAINTTSTGASLGFLAGSIIPGLGNLFGTGIGAGLGALVGGLGSLFGFGDNEDEVRDQMRRLRDATSRRNIMALAVAESKDLEAHAALGKPAYGKMLGGNKHGNKVELLQGPDGYMKGKALSMVQPGEAMYNTETYSGEMVEGKGSGDTVPSYISQNDPTIVFSEKLGTAQIAEPIIKQLNILKDIIANTKASSKKGRFLIAAAQKALEDNNQALLELGEEQNIIRDNMLIRKYKNGKCLPGYALGTIGEYALTALPHIGGLIGNITRYNRAKNADTYAPNIYVDDSEGRAAVNELNNLRYDVNPYLRDAHKALTLQNWLTRRNVGLGLGGRAIAQNANFQSYLNSLANVYNAKNEAENKFITMRSDAKAKLGAANRQYRTAGLNNQFGWQQLQNAAKEGYLDQILKDRYTISTALGSDLLSMEQYKQALALQNRLVNIYQQNANTDKIKALAYVNNR